MHDRQRIVLSEENHSVAKRAHFGDFGGDGAHSIKSGDAEWPKTAVGVCRGEPVYLGSEAYD